MARVKFLRDFRGVATAERFYSAGQVVDLPDEQAAACLAERVVSLAEVPPVEQPVAVNPSPTATGKPARKRASKKAASP